MVRETTKKPRKFVSPNDIRWGELNRAVLQCSKRGEWENVIEAYRMMIIICQLEGRDYAHLEEAMADISRRLVLKKEEEKEAKRKSRHVLFAWAFAIVVFILMVYLSNNH